MTKIALFDAKPYDRASFDAANAGRCEFRYFEARLTAESVPLADGCAGVCAFVNDAVDAATVEGLVCRSLHIYKPTRLKQREVFDMEIGRTWRDGHDRAVV